MKKHLVQSFIFSFLFALSGCGGGSSSESSIAAPHEAQSWSLLNQSHGGDGSAWGLAECDSCHVLSIIHPDRANIRPIVKAKGYNTCTGCHGSNGTGEPRACLTCHNGQNLPESPLQQGAMSHNFTAEANTLTDENCISCHQASDMDGQFDLQTDLTRFTDHNLEYQPYQSKTDFCLRCHNSSHQQAQFEISGKAVTDPLIAMADNYQFIDWHGQPEGSGQRTYSGLRNGYRYQSTVECTDCHAMHGSHNKNLIIASSRSGVSLLDEHVRQQNYPVTINDNDTSQLCVLCHSMEIPLEQGETDTGNGLQGVHATGSECSSCHSHGQPTQVGL